MARRKSRRRSRSSRKRRTARKRRTPQRYRAELAVVQAHVDNMQTFLDRYVNDLEEWKTVAKKYEQVYILTMNSLELNVYLVCEKILGKAPHVYSRQYLKEQYRNVYTKLTDKLKSLFDSKNITAVVKTAVVKVCAAYCIYLDNSKRKVYFTDDSFEEDVISDIAYMFQVEPWLVYRKATPGNTDHVIKQDGCAIWCIDFDLTMTHYQNPDQYLKDLKNIVPLPERSTPVDTLQLLKELEEYITE